ncbi:hypothetical protein, partial [Paraclostridium bifermentans]|uniref:hypothetical protein n=1 Tax=Paraclostridium bifermentans TaxID=1490 RepID=UPI0022E366C9
MKNMFKISMLLEINAITKSKAKSVTDCVVLYIVANINIALSRFNIIEKNIYLYCLLFKLTFNFTVLIIVTMYISNNFVIIFTS